MSNLLHVKMYPERVPVGLLVTVGLTGTLVRYISCAKSQNKMVKLTMAVNWDSKNKPFPIIKDRALIGIKYILLCE